MPYHLLTVDHCHLSGSGLQLAPTVRLARLTADHPPGTNMPMRGDPVELRMPDGTRRPSAIALFGIDGWKKGDHFYTASNPADPQLTLTIAEQEPGNLPSMTQVWLPGVESADSMPEPGPCSYCQVLQARGSA